MIISHKYKFIFFKNNKCAGSSVEIALGKFCGPDDVVTHLSPEEEEIRSEMGGRNKQNTEVPKENYTTGDKIRTWLGKPAPVYFPHMRARAAKPRISPEIWESYFKFCVVRNPWDRVASLHYWRARDGVRTTVEKSKVTKGKTLRRFNDQGWGLYTINNKPVMDYFCRFESLWEDLETVGQKLGFPEPLARPQAKASFRKSRGKKNYRELFTPEEIERIGKYFRREIELFNYTP